MWRSFLWYALVVNKKRIEARTPLFENTNLVATTLTAPDNFDKLKPNSKGEHLDDQAQNTHKPNAGIKMLKPTPMIVCISAIVTLLGARVCQGQDFSITKEFRSESVDQASQLLIDRYVFPEIGEKAAERLLSQKANGDFDRFDTLAANPGDLVPLNDQLQLFVSDVSVTHPSDGSTWEGIGIVPDVACDSEEALEITLKMARNAAHDFNVSNERRATDAVAHLDRVQQTFDSETSTELVVDAYLECKRHGIFFSEWELNRLGYERLGEPAQSKLGEAILRANSVLHPDSANVFDSYGDALSASGDLKQALYNYRKAVEIGTPQDHEYLEQFKANVKRIEQELAAEDGVSGGNQAGNNTECNIYGTCIDVENQSIVLLRPADDPRHDKLVEHPIIDGEFKAVVKLTHPECFLLAFGDEVKTGAYRTMVVFLEPGGKVELTVHPQTEFEKNTIEGCELNREYSQYLSDFDTRFGGQERSLWKKQDELVLSETRHRAAMKKLEAERSQKDSTDLQRKAEELDREGKSLSISRIELANEYRTTNQEISNWRLDYVLEKRSLVSYYLLYDDVFQNGPDIEDVESLREASEKFADKYPSHPYTLALKALLDGWAAKRVGQRFIDFSAPDLDGIAHRLSDEIKGKVALIDLWATWCGPCIVKSRKMIPIYNEFKTDGFTVVGVAGEFDNTSSLEAFLKRENFPWLNLVELDRQNRIWEKYGVHGGGEKILVDESGIILAIDPSADELNAILSKRYR